MSQTISYQTLLGETITDFVINKKIEVETIMMQVMESIMLAEREIFLKDQPGNKGNGFYERIESAIESTLPHRYIQICMVHKVRNLLTKVRHKDKKTLCDDWRKILGLDDEKHSQQAFNEKIQAFIDKWSKHYPSIRNALPESKWRYYSAYLNYPYALRRMLYTTNWIERLNKEIRKITRHVNSFPHVDCIKFGL